MGKLEAFLLAFIVASLVSVGMLFSMQSEFAKVAKFKAWARRNRKKFDSEESFEKKYATFSSNQEQIETHNLKNIFEQQRYDANVNQFSDLTDEEFGQQFFDSVNVRVNGDSDNLPFCSKRIIGTLTEETVMSQGEIGTSQQLTKLSQYCPDKSLSKVRNSFSEKGRMRESSTYALVNAMEIKFNPQYLQKKRQSLTTVKQVKNREIGHSDSISLNSEAILEQIKLQFGKRPSKPNTTNLMISYQHIMQDGVSIVQIQSYSALKKTINGSNTVPFIQVGRLQIQGCQRIGFFSNSINLQHDLEKIVVEHSVLVTISFGSQLTSALKIYRSGIIDLSNLHTNPFEIQENKDRNCLTLLLVGFANKSDDENRHESYWILENSWGKQWGEDGYLRVRKTQFLTQFQNVTLSYPIF